MTIHDKIRVHFSAFGFDISDMSDEDIDAGAERMAQATRSLGVTAQQAHDGLSRLTARLKEGCLE